MSFQSILGQDKPLGILKNSFKNNNLAHAYLFMGPDGVGKKLTATRMAKSLNCLVKKTLDNCETCNSCRRIEIGIHPDVFLIEPEKSSSNSKEGFIKIAAIRELQKNLNFKPYEGKNKIAIINDAECLNPQAANALLKTLEEPPSATVIILITSKVYQLIPTVISRCQGVKFGPLTKETLRQIVSRRKNIDAKEVDFRVGRASGRAWLALDDSLLKNIPIRNELIELFDVLSFDRSEQIFKWSKTWAKQPERLNDMLDELSLVLRDLSVLKSSGNFNYSVNQDLMFEMNKLAKKKPLSAWLKIFQTVNETRLALKTNQNTQLALEMMLIRFCETL